MVSDAEINARYPEVTPTRVEITLKSGRVIRNQVDMPKGDPRAPISEPELLAKFRHLAGMAVDGETVSDIETAILDLDHRDDLAPVFELLNARKVS